MTSMSLLIVLLLVSVQVSNIFVATGASTESKDICVPTVNAYIDATYCDSCTAALAKDVTALATRAALKGQGAFALLSSSASTSAASARSNLYQVVQNLAAATTICGETTAVAAAGFDSSAGGAGN